MHQRTAKIIAILNRTFPNPKPFLNFRTPFESLVATMLSAQCTDARVNIVTKIFFKAANTPQKMVRLGQKKIEHFVRSTGFYRAKTKNILAMSNILLEEFHGKVPDTLEYLQKLPGVGRKTASVVLSQSFHIPAFPVDRHVLRVANRLGLAHQKDPDKTDLELRKNIPEKHWIPLHIQLISLGRSWCRPQPKCTMCPLLSICPEEQRRQRSSSKKI